MAAALVATASYGLTVVPDTANTSITAPQGGSFKTAAVGSASVKRVIEAIFFSAVATTVKSALMFFKYDGTTATPIPGDFIEIKPWTMDMTADPPRPPFSGWVFIPKEGIDLPDNTWSIICTVYTSQAIRVTSSGADYS